MSHIQTVQEIYAAFGQGDIPAVLAALDDGVAWEPGMIDRGIPWLKPGQGKAHAAAFFQTVGANLAFSRFEPLTILGDDNQVVAVLAIEATVIPTGKQIVETAEVHLWSFNRDGKVSAFRHVVDTIQHLAAATP